MEITKNGEVYMREAKHDPYTVKSVIYISILNLGYEAQPI
jgi:hypothetical protein